MCTVVFLYWTDLYPFMEKRITEFWEIIIPRLGDTRPDAPTVNFLSIRGPAFELRA